VTDRDAGQRIDNFLLRTLKGVPRSHVYRLLRSGQVRVNRGRVQPSRKLAAGDELRIPPVRQGEASKPHRAPDALLQRVGDSVIHEDADFIVLNKPAGLPVHGGSGVAYGVIEVLRQLRPAEPFLELAHRLDRETSGCLVIARNRPALQALHHALREGEAEKRYLALVCGKWSGGPREARDALEKNRSVAGERRVQTSEGGQAAHSVFEPLKLHTLRDGMHVSLMAVRILTGRTHQIRVHAAHLGHPVAGDEKYGGREANQRLRKAGLRRMFLHAERFKAQLPALGRTLACHAPLPADLAEFIEGQGSHGH
jgi:23S rRNA pseudouridine955/2504/2580 synthase